MFEALNSLAKALNVKPKNVTIDNHVFRLHYRATVWLLAIAAGIIWSNDFYGNKIQCTHSRAEDQLNTHKQLDHVMNQWCYHMGVFVVPRHHSKNESKGNMEVHYAGVGPVERDEPLTKLSWYQWVVYAFILQAVCFYLPHIIWRIKENRVIYTFLKGYSKLNFFSEEERIAVVQDVNKNMFNRLKHYSPWAYWLFLCEVLNLVNLIGQWFLTDWFLLGKFSTLGYALTEDRSDPNQFSILDIAFPKMAKCTFNDYGHTGQVQNSDVLCVLTNNILYEKIYLFLWVWYVILMTLTAMAIVHRLLSWITYKTNIQYYTVTMYQSDGLLKPDDGNVRLIMDELEYPEWVFLQYLLSNMDVKSGVILLEKVADTIRQTRTSTYQQMMVAPLITNDKKQTEL